MMKTESVIQINDLFFGYDSDQPLICIRHWDVKRQANVFLHGPSGSGKSTLLNLLSGILTPQAGEIYLLGKALNQMKSRQRDRFRAEHIGVIFQEFNLIPFLTVKENIELAAYFSRKNHSDLQPSISALFDRLKLSHQLLSKRADALSVGQRQRVSIARAFINQPDILIADEPTSALDTDNRDEFMRLLLETSAQSACTVVFVSHDRTLASHFAVHQDIRELSIEENHAI